MFKRVNMRAPPELKKIHPLGKAPVLTVESTAISTPLVLAESGLIIEYLVEHYGKWLAPNRYREGKEGQVGGESEEWMRYRYYIHYNEGSLMPFFVIALLLNGIFAFVNVFLSQFLTVNSDQNLLPFFIRPIAKAITGAIESSYISPNLKTSFEFLESQIASSPNHGEYLCGSELTAADIAMSFPLELAKGRAQFTQEKHPKLWAYINKLEALPGYKRAVQKIVEVDGSFSANL